MIGGPGTDRFICTEGAEEDISDYSRTEDDIIENPELCESINQI